MSYARVAPMGALFSFRGSLSTSGGASATTTTTGTARTTSGTTSLIIPPAPSEPDLPPCIPERYVAAAQQWCDEQQNVRGLGATPMPVEYMGAPCRAARLPVCPAGKEPPLTEPAPVRPAVRVVGTRTTTTTRPAVRTVGTRTPAATTPAPETAPLPTPAEAAAAGIPWWVWAAGGGALLLTFLLLRKGK